MLRSRTLFVLGQLGSAPGADESEVVRRRIDAYRHLDPVARELVRRRVTRAVVDALHETERADDERHVHRLAYLRVAGHDAFPDDVEDVRAAFEAEVGARKKPSRFGFLFGCTATCAVLLASGAALAWYLTRPPPPLRDELPPSRGAWVDGGRPDPGSAAVRAVFEQRLPDWTVALDAVRRSRDTPEEASAVAAMRRAHGDAVASATATLGPDATSFLVAVLEQSESIVVRDEVEGADSHIRSVDAFNASVAGLGLGYYVDADIAIEVATGRGRVYLSTFSVERVTLYRSGDDRVRALRLRRLDRLNFTRAVLGFTRPQVVDALVLGERVEGFLVQHLLPGLAEGESTPLVDPDARASAPPWLAALEAAAAEDSRAEAIAIVGDEERVEAIGALFARRRRFFDDLAERLEPRGVSVSPPTTYAIDRRARLSMERVAVPHELGELDEVMGDLDDGEIRATYGELEETLVASIERHEVQHRLDYMHDVQDELPAAVEAHTGPLRVGDRDNARARSANAELSAYLAELVRGPHVVRTNLVFFARHALDRRQWGRGECYAALVVIEGLARRLGIGHEPLVVRREVNRAAVAAIYSELRTRSADELSSTASALWEELYGSRLPPLE